MAATKTVVAAGLIVFRRISSEVQYLMLQASYGDYHWSPPKGHLDKNETEMEAALRETEEEAGLSRDQLHIYDEFQSVLHYQVRNRPKKVVYWLSELKDSTLAVKLSNEHTDFKWLNLEEATDIAKYDDLKTALKEANNYILTEVLKS